MYFCSMSPPAPETVSWSAKVHNRWSPWRPYMNFQPCRVNRTVEKVENFDIQTWFWFTTQSWNQKPSRGRNTVIWSKGYGKDTAREQYLRIYGVTTPALRPYTDELDTSSADKFAACECGESFIGELAKPLTKVAAILWAYVTLMAMKEATALEESFKEPAADGKCQGVGQTVGHPALCYSYDCDGFPIKTVGLDDAIQRLQRSQ